jgi:hypothetical protein
VPKPALVNLGLGRPVFNINHVEALHHLPELFELLVIQVPSLGVPVNLGPRHAALAHPDFPISRKIAIGPPIPTESDIDLWFINDP